MRNNLLKKTRQDWTAKQAVEDIERQLNGEKLPPESVVETSDLQHPSQRRLLAALTVPAENSLRAQQRRRCNAIQAVIAYCPVQERRVVFHDRPTVKECVAAPEVMPFG